MIITVIDFMTAVIEIDDAAAGCVFGELVKARRIDQGIIDAP